MVNGQKLALFFLLAILVNVVQSRRNNNNDDYDNDDDDYDDDNGGGRHKCTSDDELQSCNNACDEHSECTRYSYDLECDDVCRFVCKYISWNMSRKCVINLTGQLQDERDNNRGESSSGGSRGRRGGGGGGQSFGNSNPGSGGGGNGGRRRRGGSSNSDRSFSPVAREPPASRSSSGESNDVLGGLLNVNGGDNQGSGDGERDSLIKLDLRKH